MKEKVTILLSTYNGEKYLDEQLCSLFIQENVEIQVFVRDDGSTDKTCSILEKWASEYPLTWYQGNNIGPSRSFMELIYRAPQSSYYAFCDQDDVWDANKLDIAVKSLHKFTQNKPALYFSGYRRVDKNLNVLSEKVTFGTISFGNSLVQNISLGCTMVFNKEAKELAKKINTTDGNMHDAWLYKLWYATGNVYFDKESRLSYRQHDNNVIGGRKGFIKNWIRRTKRIKRVWNGRISNHTKEFRKHCSPYINDSEKLSLISILADYKINLKSRWKLILSKEIVMQSKFDTVLFKLLVLLGRV
jgi:glycosyltransferase involved in cell wall biosynthesis